MSLFFHNMSKGKTNFETKFLPKRIFKCAPFRLIFFVKTRKNSTSRTKNQPLGGHSFSCEINFIINFICSLLNRMELSKAFVSKLRMKGDKWEKKYPEWHQLRSSWPQMSELQGRISPLRIMLKTFRGRYGCLKIALRKRKLSYKNP
jgi:hypothetical protein